MASIVRAALLCLKPPFFYSPLFYGQVIAFGKSENTITITIYVEHLGFPSVLGTLLSALSLLIVHASFSLIRSTYSILIIIALVMAYYFYHNLFSTDVAILFFLYFFISFSHSLEW